MSSRQALRLSFSDLWGDFDPEENAFTRALGAHVPTIVTTPESAEVLIYGDYGRCHEDFVGTKVSYSSECRRPDWMATDFAIGYELCRDDRYLRFPLYALIALDDERDPPLAEPTPLWEERRHFCSFVQSVPGDPIRRQIVEALSEYRTVDCAGAFLNNVEAPELSGRREIGWRRSKIAYQRRFRFVVAFENRSHPGYTTEKLYDALVAGAIPVYWGNPRVDDDFDPRAFIWCRGPEDVERVVGVVAALDADPSLAAELLAGPRAPRVPAAIWSRRLEDFLGRVAGFARTRDRESAERRVRALEVRSLVMKVRRRARLVGDRLRGRG